MTVVINKLSFKESYKDLFAGSGCTSRLEDGGWEMEIEECAGELGSQFVMSCTLLSAEGGGFNRCANSSGNL